MQICTSPETDNHAGTPPLSFLQARCPFCHPSNSVKALSWDISEGLKVRSSHANCSSGSMCETVQDREMLLLEATDRKWYTAYLIAAINCASPVQSMMHISFCVMSYILLQQFAYSFQPRADKWYVCFRVEHLPDVELSRLPKAIFGQLAPRLVIITTPNAEFNVLFPNLTGFRHHDHKFEWTRQQFGDW